MLQNSSQFTKLSPQQWVKNIFKTKNKEYTTELVHFREINLLNAFLDTNFIDIIIEKERLECDITKYSLEQCYSHKNKITEAIVGNRKKIINLIYLNKIAYQALNDGNALFIHFFNNKQIWQTSVSMILIHYTYLLYIKCVDVHKYYKNKFNECSMLMVDKVPTPIAPPQSSYTRKRWHKIESKLMEKHTLTKDLWQTGSRVYIFCIFIYVNQCYFLYFRKGFKNNRFKYNIL